MVLGVEEQVDREDWERFRRQEELSDHWWWRPGWRPDRHYITWYVTFTNPELVAYVQRFQAELADLSYLDPVPADGLHMTVQGVGFSDELTDEECRAIAAEARKRCRALGPATLCVGPIGAYSGGTFLRVTPWGPVAELRDRLREAISAVRGEAAVPAEPVRFKPHISVAYCHAAVPAQELAGRLVRLRKIEPVGVVMGAVDLLELWREQHAYRWHQREHVALL